MSSRNATLPGATGSTEHRARSALWTTLRITMGVIWGLVAGVVVSLGVVVFRAWAEEVYLHSLWDVVGWVGLPAALGPLAGAWWGASSGAGLRRGLAGSLTGLALGALLGSATGAYFGSDEPAVWAGGILGAAAGVLLGVVAALLVRWGASFVRYVGRSRAQAGVTAGLVLGAALGAACTGADPDALPVPGDVPDTPAERVESVVFFVGDPGEARKESHPILLRVRNEVERWSRAVAMDSAVTVVVLGDIIYPDGMAAPDQEGFAEDSARVAEQIAMVDGPWARRYHSRLVFVPGNHDWGQEEDFEGAVRLHRLAEFVEPWRATGVPVFVEPTPGTGGPTHVDVGEHLRLVFLDTAWWLLEGEVAARRAVIRGVEAALAGAGSRKVVLAAHHPFASAGPHGDLLTLGASLGVRTLLARSGALLQDLHSRPYRELRLGLTGVFERTRPPELFAGGHEHSLQVIRGLEPTDPGMTLVSGSASKLTSVGGTPGMVFGQSAPGYGRLLVRKDGGLELFVEAAPPRWLACSDEDRDCVSRGAEAYRTVWAEEL